MKFTRICALTFLFMAFSCKKERTCECTNSQGTYESGTLEATRSYAKKYCKSLSGGETSCKLKD